MKDLRFRTNVRCMRVCMMLVTFIPFFTFGACGSDNSSGGEPTLDAPVLVSSVPVNGAVDIADGKLTVVLTFDQNVTAPSARHNEVTAGTATVESVSASFKEVTIQLSGLAKGETYTLTVPRGVILGPTKVEANQVAITFSTVKKPEAEPITTTLCTPNPLPQAKKVYDYLASVYGTKTLSGAMANVTWNINEAELVKAATGKYPAIAFFDYIHLAWSPADWIDYSDTQIVEDWWNANGLVGASWHWNVPAAESDADDLNKYTCRPGNGQKNSDGNWTTTFRPANIFVEGSWENRTVKADLEKMAGYLKLLQDKGIPVIWRPLHEAAGNIYEYTGGEAWFWWGYDGAEVYKRLWIYMFDFFKDKGISNLIWVWTTQQKDADFYPGDAYVDIVGRDIYKQTAETDNAVQYNTVLGAYSKKLIALSECGSVAKISSQWNAGARWSFFMPWFQYDATTLDGHEHADTAWWKDAMRQDYVVSRDELPSMK